ncbi:hypothetical protein GmHk_14G041007 [Glycine max]|nr:hypothetical protein GmHk_14G041007 [Glycine max]
MRGSRHQRLFVENIRKNQNEVDKGTAPALTYPQAFERFIFITENKKEFIKALDLKLSQVTLMERKSVMRWFYQLSMTLKDNSTMLMIG